ncbi:MAG: putative HNHc nuclease [Clostridiales bacterium]|nr:putative HNHc nuclease [Clostridiales bacterium]
MKSPIDTCKGRITEYDERAGEVVIRAKYDDLPTMLRREYKECSIQMIDSRPLSAKQRRNCYAMIGEIADWMGEEKSEAKELLKVEFWTAELWQTADSLFSLSNAPMSVVAAFQRWLARFIVRNDIPTKKSLISYVDDVGDYVYSCLINKRCCVCGKRADLHHIDRVGMGRDRTDIIHEGMEVLPLCREHHTEAHTMPDSEFFEKYHLNGGVEMDKTLCKIYGLKAKRGNQK